MVVFGQRGCIRAKDVVFGHIGYIRAFLLYSDRVVLFPQKLLYSGKVVVFGKKSCCFRAKVVVLRHSGVKLESGCILAKILYS